MKKNVGSLDRWMRGGAAVGAGVGAAVVPSIAPSIAHLHLALRLGLLATGLYLAWTALAGTCLGYRMMGLSTCPTPRPR